MVRVQIQAGQRAFTLYAVIAFMVFITACQSAPADHDPAPWYTKLPKCPCENPDRDSVSHHDGWARDLGNIARYHAGSQACFRSYPAVTTSVGRSGQQCCYDATGKLIPCGSGAGTPDMVSTCAGEDRQGIMRTNYTALWGHWRNDVQPWEAAGGPDSGWVRYNLIHPPDTGIHCR